VYYTVGPLASQRGLSVPNIRFLRLQDADVEQLGQDVLAIGGELAGLGGPAS
jgi:hypothetical protein